MTWKTSVLCCVLAASVAVVSGCDGKGRSSAATADDGQSKIAEKRTESPRSSYRVYVTNEMSGDLSVINPESNTVIHTVPLGKRPRGLQPSPDATKLFVALSGSPIAGPGADASTLPPADKSADGIGVVDLGELRLLTVLRGVSDPEQVAVGRAGNLLYVASEDTGQAIVLNATNGTLVASLPVGGEPEGVAVSPDGSVVLVTSEEDHAVAVIDTARHEVANRVVVGLRPRNAAFSPDGSRIYVPGENDASLTVIDARDYSVIARVSLPGENVRPMGVVVSPNGERVYITTGRGKAVMSIDSASYAILGSVEVGERPWGLAISPDGALLYTANGPSNDVTVVDAERMQVLAKIPVGNRPWGVAVVPHPKNEG